MMLRCIICDQLLFRPEPAIKIEALGEEEEDRSSLSNLQNVENLQNLSERTNNPQSSSGQSKAKEIVIYLLDKYFNFNEHRNLNPPPPLRDSLLPFYCDKCGETLLCLNELDDELEVVQYKVSRLVSSISSQILANVDLVNLVGSHHNNVNVNVIGDHDEDVGQTITTEIDTFIRQFRHSLYRHYNPKVNLINCMQKTKKKKKRLKSKLKLKLKPKLKVKGSKKKKTAKVKVEEKERDESEDFQSAFDLDLDPDPEPDPDPELDQDFDDQLYSPESSCSESNFPKKKKQRVESEITNFSLKSNSSSKNPEGNGPFICPVCPDRKFKWRGSLRDHIRYKHAAPTDLPCPFCPKSFHITGSLRTHIKLKHPDEKPPRKEAGAKKICEFCGKLFLNATALKAHKFSHVEDRPFVCEAEGCNSRFKKLKDLKMHSTSHKDVKEHLCSSCGMAFKGIYNLNRHWKRIHNREPGVKPYSCSFPDCARKFREYSSMRRHEQTTHSGLRPFVCLIPGCGRAFNRREHLKTHNKLIHEKSREQHPPNGEGVSSNVNVNVSQNRENHNQSESQSQTILQSVDMLLQNFADFTHGV